MTKQLLAVAVALAAFTACSDNNLSEVETGFNPSVDGLAMNSAVLTDANGQQVFNVSANQGTYYLNIKTDGMWYIESPNMEFSPTRICGHGNMRVPVYIGNNWAEARQLTYKVSFFDENGQSLASGMTRGEGTGTSTLSQEALLTLDRFKTIINSNVFVGYGFNRTKNEVPELCTGIQIFDMERLNANDTLVKHDFAPETKEDYYYHHSDSMLNKVIAVKGDFGGNFGSVKLGVGADVNKTDQTSFGETVVQKTLRRSMYSREIAWEKMWRKDATYSEGYNYYKDRFITDFIAAGNDSVKKRAAAEEFFRIVGTHVITKCLLGCELNYRMTVDSSKTRNLLDVKAALDIKWQQQIKDTAQLDSATKAKMVELMNDSTKRKSFFFSGNATYTNDQFNAASSTKAKVKARGNDVELVNILTTGGSLKCDDLAKWMLGAEPEKAAMVGMQVHPIYDIFEKSSTTDEGKAREYLVEIIDKYYCLDENKYGNDLKIDLSDLK